MLCPICNSEAQEINKGMFDGTTFCRRTHGEFEVALIVDDGAEDQPPLQHRRPRCWMKRWAGCRLGNLGYPFFKNALHGR